MNSLVCVDASLIMRALVPAHLSDAALELLETWQGREITLIAPALLGFEVTSALRRLVFSQEITPPEGEEAFEQFLQMDIRLSTQRGILPLAWELAKDLHRPRAYDTSYLALAQLRRCEFWTADERLYNSVSHKLAWVQWLGNFSPQEMD